MIKYITWPKERNAHGLSLIPGITGIKAAKCLQKEVSPNVSFSLDCLFFTML